MTQREKNLAIAVVALVVGYGAWLGWGGWNDAVDQRTRDRDAAAIALSEAQLREAKSRAALRQLETLRERSLPANPEIAQAAYRDWLIDGVAKAGLTLESIRPIGAPVERAGAYTSLPFKVLANGDQQAVARFLHRFYSSPATHKITQLKLTPTDLAEQLRVDLDLQAIIVRGASRKSGMPDWPSERLAFSSAEEYLSSLANRDLFAAYTPPPPPKPKSPPKVAKKAPPKPPFDDSTQAHFTGTVGSGSVLQAWVVVRTQGKRLTLGPGDELKVGLLEGRVVEVRPRQLIYETDGKHLAVPLGDSLRDAAEVVDEKLL